MEEYIKNILKNTRFYSAGTGLDMRLYIPFYNAHRIKLGNNILFFPMMYLHVNDGCLSDNREYNLHIEDNVQIGANNRIEVFNFIWIKKQALLGPNVYISDLTHKYEDVTKSVMVQGENREGQVIIGEGAWLGANTVVAGNVKVGKGAVIGANTVLSNINVPSHCVVVGNPPTLIKIYDYEVKQWLKVGDIPPDRLKSILEQREE